MGKRGPRRSNIQRERDLVVVADLYLKGYTQEYIAGIISKEYVDPLTRQQIGYDIKKLIKRWQHSQLVDINDVKVRELAKVDHLERVYWTAWEHSCEDAEMVTQKTKGTVQRRQDEDGTFVSERPAEATKTSKGQAGDPRFLAGVQWCIDKRCKILGIDAAVRLEHTGKDGGPIETKNINDYSPAEHARAIVGLVQALRPNGDQADGREQNAVDTSVGTPVAGDTKPSG